MVNSFSSCPLWLVLSGDYLWTTFSKAETPEFRPPRRASNPWHTIYSVFCDHRIIRSPPGRDDSGGTGGE